jgi:hypothetical protein
VKILGAIELVSRDSSIDWTLPSTPAPTSASSNNRPGDIAAKGGIVIQDNASYNKDASHRSSGLLANRSHSTKQLYTGMLFYDSVGRYAGLDGTNEDSSWLDTSPACRQPESSAAVFCGAPGGFFSGAQRSAPQMHDLSIAAPSEAVERGARAGKSTPPVSAGAAAH